jgi:tetratricopeptide (TPR) repeat protein
LQKILDATAYALRGQITEALALLEESEAQTPSVRIFDTPTARTALATGYLLAGRLSAAGEVASGAAELAAAREFRGTQAWAVHLLGEISARRDPPEVASAEEHYRRALALAEELGMLPLVAHCHRGLGRLYHCVGERQKADEQVAIALAMYRDMDMGFWQQKTEVDLQ